MGFARVGSNPTVVDNFLPNLLSLRFVLVAQWIAHQTSDLGVGGSSPPRDLSTFLVFFRQHEFIVKPLPTKLKRGCKFGRVVKALALGASLERGMGSNPIACT